MLCCETGDHSKRPASAPKHFCPSWFTPGDRHGRQAQSAGPGMPTSHEDLGAQSWGRPHVVWGRWNMGYSTHLSTSVGILKNI